MEPIGVASITLSSVTLLGAGWVLLRNVKSWREGYDHGSSTSRLRKMLVICLMVGDVTIAIASSISGAMSLHHHKINGPARGIIGLLMASATWWQCGFATAIAGTTYLALRHPLAGIQLFAEARPWTIILTVFSVGLLQGTLWLGLHGYTQTSTFCLYGSTSSQGAEIMQFIPRTLASLTITFTYLTLVHFLRRPSLTYHFSPQPDRLSTSRFRRGTSPSSMLPPWEALVISSPSQLSPLAEDPPILSLSPTKEQIHSPNTEKPLSEFGTMGGLTPLSLAMQSDFRVDIPKPDPVYLPHRRTFSTTSSASSSSTSSKRSRVSCSSTISGLSLASDVTVVTSLARPSSSLDKPERSNSHLGEGKESEEDFWGMLKYAPPPDAEERKLGAKSRPGTSGGRGRAGTTSGLGRLVRSATLNGGKNGRVHIDDNVILEREEEDVDGEEMESKEMQVQVKSLASCMNKKTEQFLIWFPVTHLLICALVISRFILVTLRRSSETSVGVDILTLLSVSGLGLGDVVIFGIIEPKTKRSYRLEAAEAGVAAEQIHSGP
ncbi:hypothetical protein M231_01902 [Tremella mesenterica]|uniref:Glucose receptor Git3 N-terminal domain-containing protein n=1 Tax=Tremella mesenterica TaxID=5217 RepID=A0A4Q1BS63_TREME|nr:hypothetical protein M231_01902 [Tremella mesenterica]